MQRTPANGPRNNGNALNEVLTWCRENGTTLDLVIRAFFRFAADPKNRSVLEHWAQEQKIQTQQWHPNRTF